MNPQASTYKSIVIGIAGLFLFVVAILLDLPYLYLMALALWALPMASYALAHGIKPRFSVTRVHPTTVTEGRRVPVHLQVRAEQGIPQASAFFADKVPAALLPESATQKFGTTTLTPLETWDGTSGSGSYTVEPNCRGVYTLGPTQVTTTDPLGLFFFSASVAGATELVVHPEPIPARDRAIGGEGLFGVRERDGRTRQGEGMDFHGVREYRPGDALRRVHWRTTARTGKLAVVEYERAYQQDLVIGLDLARGTEHGPGRETTLEYAIKVAATLADRTLAAGGGLTLITQHARLTVRPGESDPAAQRFRLMDYLARAHADSPNALAESLRALRPENGAHWAILTASGDPRLSEFLTGRMRRGDSVQIFFFEPASFGGPSVTTPAVAGGTLRIVERAHSPWQKGGKELEYLLRENHSAA